MLSISTPEGCKPQLKRPARTGTAIGWWQKPVTHIAKRLYWWMSATRSSVVRVSRDELLGGQSVSDPRFGKQAARLCRIFLDFVAQMRHKDAQIIRLLYAIRTPDFLE
jgi:hypothetical protein